MNRSWGIGVLALALSLSGCAGTARRGVATRAPASERVGSKVLAWRGRTAATTPGTDGEGRDRATPKEDTPATQSASARAAGAVPSAADAPASRRDAVSERVARYFPMFNRGGAATARSEILKPAPDLWAESARASARSRSRSDDRRKAEPGDESSVLAVAMDVAPGRTTVRPRLAPIIGRRSPQSTTAAGGDEETASPVVDPQAETATLPGPVESDPRSGVERTSAEGLLPPSSATPRPDEGLDTPPPPDHPSAAPDPKSSRSEAPPPSAPTPVPDEPAPPASATEKAPAPEAPTVAAPVAPEASEPTPTPEGPKVEARRPEPAPAPAPEKPQTADPVAEPAPPTASRQAAAPSATAPGAGALTPSVPTPVAAPVSHTAAKTGWLLRTLRRLGRHEAKGAHSPTRPPLPTPPLPSKQMPGIISSAVATAAGGGQPLVDGPIFPAAYYADPGRSPYYARFDANGRTNAPAAPAPIASGNPAEARKPSVLSRVVGRFRGVSEVDRHPAGCECGKHPRTAGAMTASQAGGAATAASVGAESRDLAERRDVLHRVVADRLHEPAQR